MRNASLAAVVTVLLTAACTSPAEPTPSTGANPGASQDGSAVITPELPSTTTAPSGQVTPDPSPADPPASPVPVETSQVPDWAALGAARMQNDLVCTDPGSAPQTMLSVLTSTSAVHFAGCVRADGNMVGGASVYMQPDPAECLWAFQYQITCGSDEVTLVWQADASRGFVPNQRGVVGVPGPDAVLTGTIDGARWRYRFFGDPQQGFSVIEAA